MPISSGPLEQTTNPFAQAGPLVAPAAMGAVHFSLPFVSSRACKRSPDATKTSPSPDATRTDDGSSFAQASVPSAGAIAISADFAPETITRPPAAASWSAPSDSIVFCHADSYVTVGAAGLAAAGATGTGGTTCSTGGGVWGRKRLTPIATPQHIVVAAVVTRL